MVQNMYNLDVYGVFQDEKEGRREREGEKKEREKEGRREVLFLSLVWD